MSDSHSEELFNAIIELQEKLYEISDSFESITQYIHSHEDFFLKDKISLRRLLLVINSTVNSTPHQLFHYQKIINYLKDEIKSHFSSNEIFNVFKENKSLLLFLVNENLMNISSLFSTKKHYEELQFYFAPEILESLRYKKRRFYDNRFKSYLFEKMDVKEHIEIRSKLINPEPILISIREDNLNSFQDALSRLEIDLSDTKINHSIFEPFSFLNETITIKLLTLIEYASFYGSVNIVKYLIANEVELKKFRAKFAIAGGNYEIIHLLGEREVNIDTIDCLATAIQFHHNDIVHYLHDTKNVNYEISLIEVCVKFENISMLEEILNDIPKSENDRRPFILSIISATRNGNIDLLLFLFDQAKQREIQIQNDEQLMVKLLNRACKYGYIDIAQFFINELHIPYSYDNFKGLYKASKIGNLPTVQYLCGLDGINVNYTDQVSKDTPLTIAAYQGYIDVVKFLFTVKGVDINHKLYNNRNAIFRAAEGQNYEILKFLYENTPNSSDIINVIDLNGFNLLTMSSQYDCPEIVKYLIEQKGFDVNSLNSRPIIHAIQNDCVNVLKYFLTLDNCKLINDENGQTAIHYASYYQIEDILKILIESKKIDINAQDKTGVLTIFYLCNSSSDGS